uniref:Uncharacterized protein n=1 Tax=Ixodes ricinus TaxID=34613 RepID=A0A6B0UZ12_IXORI
MPHLRGRVPHLAEQLLVPLLARRVVAAGREICQARHQHLLGALPADLLPAEDVLELVYEGLEEHGRPLADQEALSSVLEAVGQRAQKVLEKLAALGLIIKESLLCLRAVGLGQDVSCMFRKDARKQDEEALQGLRQPFGEVVESQYPVLEPIVFWNRDPVENSVEEWTEGYFGELE